jgi:hypothetical protein
MNKKNKSAKEYKSKIESPKIRQNKINMQANNYHNQTFVKSFI